MSDIPKWLSLSSKHMPQFVVENPKDAPVW